ncbi:hypothetical protein GGI07_003805 [Coemansia sp. Benny D115]|nr:hypothetical protein GGI07_003805 [Coemansia sp. Benny D115]
MRVRYTYFISARADALVGVFGGLFGYFMHEQKHAETQRRPLVELMIQQPPAYSARSTTVPLSSVPITQESINRARIALTQMATASVDTQGGEEPRHVFGLRLAVLLMGAFLIRFVLGLVRYVLDFLLIVLAAGCLLAFVRPGPKDGPMLVMLGHLETVATPVYFAVSGAASKLLSGPLQTLGRFLKTANASTT